MGDASNRPTNRGSTAYRTILALAAFVIVTAGMKIASPLLVPFLLAAFFAIILSPLLLGLQRLGVGTPLAILLMVIVLIVAGWLGGALVARGAASLTNRQNLDKFAERLAVEEQRVIDWLKQRGLYDLPLDDPAGDEGDNPIDERTDAMLEPTAPLSLFSDTPPLNPAPRPATRHVRPAVAEPAAAPTGGFIENLLDPKQLPGLIQQAANAASGMLTQSFIILILVIFIMLETAGMPRKVRALPGLTDDGWQRAQRIIREIRHYMALKTVMSLLTGALVFVWLMILDVPYALLLGFLAFALNYVPNIGSTIAAIPAVLFSLFDDGGTWALINAAGYIVINVGVSNALEPRFMGKGLDLSPLVILISLFFWAWVLGPMGMLLSVPLTMTLKIVLESGDETRWIALLGGGAPPVDKAAAKAAPT